MGEPPDRLAETRATTSGAETVEQVVLYQSKFWTSLHAKEIEDGEIITHLTSEVLSNRWQTLRALNLCTVKVFYPPHLRLLTIQVDLVRRYQSAQLAKAHQMHSLYIYRDRISTSFEKEVLAT